MTLAMRRTVGVLTAIGVLSCRDATAPATSLIAIPNHVRPARYQHIGLYSPLYRRLNSDAHRWRNDDLPDLRVLLVARRPLPVTPC